MENETRPDVIPTPFVGNATVETLEHPNGPMVREFGSVETHPSGNVWVRRPLTAIENCRDGYSIDLGATGWYPRDNVRNFVVSL